MLAIVIKDNTPKEEIANFVNKYKEENNLDTFVEGKDYRILTQEEYDAEIMAKTMVLPFSILPIPEINFLKPASKTEIYQHRTEKQKKEQDKWAKRFYRKK